MNEQWAPTVIFSSVALVWALTVAMLVLASRRRRVTLAIHCPMLRRNVQVTGDEWGGRLLDVRRCSGLHPPTDFELCLMTCLEFDECATVTLGPPGNHFVKREGSDPLDVEGVEPEIEAMVAASGQSQPGGAGCSPDRGLRS